MEESKKGLFELLDKKQSFLFGIVGGLLVLCTIGFFILLAVVLSGTGTAKVAGDTTGTVVNNNAGAVAGNVVGPKQFTSCLSSGQTASAVASEQSLGESLGVQGTPATFINGYLVSGALPYTMLKQVVDTLLAGKTPDFDFMKDQQTGKIIKVTMPELKDAAWRGGSNAKVTLVEFSDFECPYCQRFVPTIDQLLAEYKDQVKFTYYTFPLTSIHANSEKAAEAFQCAKVQGKGLEMHDKLFKLGEQQQLNLNGYYTAANELGLK